MHKDKVFSRDSYVEVLQGVGDLDGAAGRLWDRLAGRRLVLLEGALGSGKTTLVSAWCRRLGVSGVVCSPTFSLIQRYASPTGWVHHVDLYRILDEGALFDIGISTCLEGYCFIEWADKFAIDWPVPYGRVRITGIGDMDRRIVLTVN